MKRLRTFFRFRFTRPAGQNIRSTSIISEGNVIHGDIKTNDDIRIDGILKGNLQCNARLFLGPGGSIEGNVQALRADIMGKVAGMMVVKDFLYLRDNASIQGDIITQKLMIEPTACFNGICKMGPRIMGLSSDIALSAHG